MKNMKKYNNTFPLSDEEFKQWLDDNHWVQSKNWLTNQMYFNILYVVEAMNIFTLYDKWYSENIDNNFTSERLTKFLKRSSRDLK